MTVRLKDIAKEFGVSIVTVSRALRGDPSISESTRARILKRMQELNYRPNLAARSLVTGRNYMIGLVIPDLVHSFFSEVARGVSGVLRNTDYTLLVSSSEQEPNRERQAIDQLVARRVDILLVASTQVTDETFRHLAETKVPYILVDRNFDGLDANFVGVNDKQVGVLATEHLISIGCQRIAHISAAGVSSVVGRQEGYRAALERAGLPVQGDCIVYTESVAELGDSQGYKATQSLLKLNPHPDAIFCYNDTVAMGAMNAIFDAGLRIPEDVALVGCGNLHYSGFLRVPLTSVDQQSTNIGERAGKLALRVVEAKSPPKPKNILLDPTLVVRESTRKSAAPSQHSS